jgi:hypothetical protein
MANKITQDTLRTFVDDLRSTHGENLASVVLYGSAAVGDEVEQQFGYNFLVALHAITPHDLRVAQAPIREWLRFGQPLPVYFTLAELKDAADVFPIEFNQMERTRKVYYGVDPFEIMTLSDINLRHQTEYELRGKLIQLRRSYIGASSSADKLAKLMSESLATFASLFRPVLLLMGKEPPVTKLDAVRATVQLLGLNGEPFERILDMRSSGLDETSLSESDANELFAEYLLQLEYVIEAVDRMADQMANKSV